MDNFLYSAWILLCIGAEELEDLNKMLKNKTKKKPREQGNGDKWTHNVQQWVYSLWCCSVCGDSFPSAAVSEQGMILPLMVFCSSCLRKTIKKKTKSQ